MAPLVVLHLANNGEQREHLAAMLGAPFSQALLRTGHANTNTLASTSAECGPLGRRVEHRL